MQFVKTVLWIVLALAVALFAIRNGGPVTVSLWSDLQMVTPLWVVVVLSFLLGLLPALALHRAARWRWRRRLEQAERTAAAASDISSDATAASAPLTPTAGGAPVPPPVITNG
mgnify:CR=1 FL=1